MDVIVTKLVEQLNSSVFILLAMLFAIGFVLWKVSAFIAVWQLKLKDHEKNLYKTHEVNDKVIALETNIGKAVDFGERIVRIETKLDLIYQKITPNPFAQSQSPIALTREGQAISTKINVVDTINRLYPYLLELVQKNNPHTAYDIQESAFAVAREQLLPLLSEAEMTALKNEAFNKGMLVDAFAIVYGIILRDRILTEKNLPLNAVDVHDPAQQTNL